MEFQVGDKVVYPSQGVSTVESVSEEEFGGMTMRCYNLRLLATDSTVIVPIRNTERVGLRGLSELSMVQEIMERLRGEGADGGGDWKDRYRANLERIKTGELEEIVDVLLCLAEVASRKTLSFRERKMFDHARQLLVVEVAEVEGRSTEDVDREVEEALERHMEAKVEEE
ncbi:MAG: CarD family transcriptional regulator [bacterium]|nr:CarD family transcriptional regulator [bacterium]